MTRKQFETLVERCEGPLRKFLTALCCGDSFLADDIAQDSFMKAYISSDSIRNEANFEAWVFKIAFNTFINYRRSEKKEVSVDEIRSMTSEQTSDSAFRYEELYSALNRLSDKERTSILLYYLQGYNIKEISDIENTSADAVKQHLSRGRIHLQKFLGHNH